MSSSDSDSPRIDTSYNFRRASPTVTTSGVVGARRLGHLREQGYAAVINLLPDDNQQAVANEQELVTNQGLIYVHIPVDFARPTDAVFAQFCRAMDALDSQQMHLHCAANFRVSAFYARYARDRGWWKTAQAEAFVLDLWNPADYPGWVAFFSAIKNR